MSSKRRLVKAIKKLSIRFTKFSKKYLTAINKPIVWLLRGLFITRRRRESANAGFVLPTVAMVAIVVVLLTTAILFRSFDRSKNASNVRVNQVVLNAATPAIDRARAKIEELLQDPTLPRGTPADGAIYDAIKKDKYRLGDETRLKLAYDFNGITGIQQSTTSAPLALDSDETLKTAWKYAVDTDNNGKKDTFTLYGIYFRSPTRSGTSGEFNRKRNPLEARTPPMDNDSTSEQCRNAAGFSTLVGNSSWYKLQSGNLGKGFFVYTVNVPIDKQTYDNLPTADQSNFEAYKGNKGFAALEFQQDRSRIPLPNNAVWYENDLEIKLGSTKLSLNGRVHTNGNLLVQVANAGGEIKLRQVSSKISCFYNQENGQISLGGNVGIGNLSQTSDQGSATGDLYKGFNTNPDETKLLDSTNKSTNSGGGSLIGFNDAAYSQRIGQMKTDGLGSCTTCQNATDGSALKTAVAASSYPNDVKSILAAKVKDTDDATTAKSILADEIEIYLRNRTRRVPFAEVSNPTGTGATTGYTTITASLDPQATWREPLNASNQFTGATTVSLKTDQLNAIYPPDQQKKGTQDSLGDRVFVGNNLPALWLQNSKYVGLDANQLITNSNTPINWTTAPITGGNQQRWRNTQIQAITDLGISDRNGFWEQKAAENPVNDLDSVGGVRIVTGAGIYVDGSGSSNTSTGPFYGRDDYSFLPVPSAAPSVVFGASDIPVWPDTMPMSSPAAPTKKGDLLMRATAVYHYKKDSGTAQIPIACVSSYYDPSDATTAKNKLNVTVPGVEIDITNGKSNNGIVYTYPGRDTFGTNKARLQRQANLKFPNGRWANQPLKDALAKISGSSLPNTGLQLADYSAIDTALCAISILNPLTTFATALTDMPAHGAIKEASFLDAREAKQISASNTSTLYDLQLEQRQPLEIRVTDIDLASLGSTDITGNEYLLPLSGIIYASREDALRDASDTTPQSELLSTTDFKLDPTRRPNGIRLINGETLARKPSTNNNAYNAKEKGLIMVSNLPAYIKGKFNLHRSGTSNTNAEIEEFTELVDDSTANTSNFYSRSTPNTNFACRPGRPGCDTGTDYWRPATIIADAMTVLSNTFKDGVRSEGDYDLNNNTGIPVDVTADPLKTARLNNGFWENNFVTSANWWQPSGSDQNFPQTTLGSYSVNGVTPIQRRINSHPIYVMEICRKLPVSECLPGDWVVGFDINGDGVLSDTAQNYLITGKVVQVSLTESQIKTYQLGQAISATTATGTVPSDWDTTITPSINSISSNKSIRQRLGAGDTGDKLALVATDRRYARRVAFARDNKNDLVESSNGVYKPMGIGSALDTTGTVYSNNGSTHGINYGKAGNNALWFKTAGNANPHQNCITSSNNTCSNSQPLFYEAPISLPSLSGQPRLFPVLQIHDPSSTSPSSIRTDGSTDSAATYRNKWLQIANANSVSTGAAFNTTFNAVFVVANSPSRPDEESAGLPNLVRFLEAWTTGNSSTPSSRTAKISGSFIQLQRSAYATAPFTPLYKNRQGTSVATLGNNLSLFDYALDDYPTSNNSGILPFYDPPARKWGFDVGLLSEQPDLFAQRFTLPPTGRPNEFFREVGRDDPWVKTLLCAGQASNQTGIPDTTNPTVTYSAAVPNEYRPSDCPSSIPSDSAS